MTRNEEREHGFPETIEEKLTALVMGELDAAGRAEVEAALAADPVLRARRAELESLLGTLQASAPAPSRLDAGRRAELRQAAAVAAGPSTPRSGLLRLPQVMKWAAVFVAVAGGVWWAGRDGGLTPEVESGASTRELVELGYTAPGRDHAGQSSKRAKGASRGAAPREQGFAGLPDLRELGYTGGDEFAPAAGGRRLADGGEAVEEEFGGSLVEGLGYVDPEAPNDGARSRPRPESKDGGTYRGPGDSPPPPPSAPATPSTPMTPGTPAVPSAPKGERLAYAVPSVESPDGSTLVPGESIDIVSARKAPGSENTSEELLDRDQRGRAENLYLAEPQIDQGDGGSELDRVLEELGNGRLGVDDDGESLSASGHARTRTGFLGRFADTAEPSQRVVIFDGYGRRYHDHDVVDRYLCRRPKESPRDMFFRYYGDNPMVRAEEDPLSTFAADVDTASYALARKYLITGNLPPKASIRTEEFLNTFRYELTPPAEDDFTVKIDYAPTPFSGSEGAGMFRIGVKAREVDRESRKPLSLVFVVDRSGSMASGNRIELVKRSLELLVDQLRDDDTVGIVAFESEAHRILDPTAGYDRYKIREAVRALQTGGSTNAEAGLVMGYEMAERAFREAAVNRIVLCSDGVANTGETDQGRILDRIRGFSERQIDLTAIGVGMGNHNDVFLERIADTGNGACHYVDDFDEAKRVLVDRFTGTMQTVARDVKIQVEFNPGVIKSWRQLGYENRAVADADFRNDAVDAGEVGAGHEVIGLYETRGHVGLAVGDWVVKVRLRWFPDGSREARETETVLKLGEGGSRFDLTEPRFRLAVVVAQFAEVLRRSYWAREDSYDELMAQAERLARDLPQDAQVRELRDMIRETRRLADRLLPQQDELALLIDESRRLRLLQAEVETATGRSVELEARLDELRQRNDELEQEIRQLLDK